MRVALAWEGMKRTAKAKRLAVTDGDGSGHGKGQEEVGVSVGAEGRVGVLGDLLGYLIAACRSPSSCMGRGWGSGWAGFEAGAGTWVYVHGSFESGHMYMCAYRPIRFMKVKHLTGGARDCAARSSASAQTQG